MFQGDNQTLPELRLPEAHPIRRMWELYRQTRSDAPEPCLRLEGWEAMPEAEVRRELMRLQVTVNMSAKQRFERLTPKKPAHDSEGEEPPPPDLDAKVLVYISQSGLSAWLMAYPPSGEGKELDRDAIDDALGSARVCYGVDEDFLDALPEKPNRYFHLFQCACGKPPVHGKDGQVVELFPRTVDRRPAMDENNRADYKSLNLFHNVEKGEVICRIIHPTQGAAGRTVQDSEISARDGKEATVPKGRNTLLTEDGGALIAKISGQVEFSGRSFQVKPLLEVDGNVDFSTGNINFVGDVHIHGDVCSGFTVRAMGNINIDGVAEACTIEAGGDLVIAGGAQGDNQAVIRAQKNIFAKYLENCCVCVKGSLQSDCIISCEVYCDDSVEVRSGRMTVIGGSIRAAHEVSAGVIGSRAESRTEIILGGLPCGQFDEGVLVRDIAELEKEYERTERQPDSPQKLGRLAKIKVNLLVNRQKLNLISKEKEEIAGETEPGIRRMTCDTVYPGTALTIDGQVYRFDRMLHPCIATLTKDGFSLA